MRDELKDHIAVTRAAQAARHAGTKFEDLGVKLGPLTAAMRAEARWRNEDHLYPAWQVFADEIERILRFADEQGQLSRCWSNLTARIPQRDSALDELRVAYHLHQHQFRVVDWEPAGLNGNRGEYLVCGPSSVEIFVEVKGPRWEGELDDEEIKAGRTKQPKELYLEGRAVAPWQRIRFEVEKAYKKFIPSVPNLLVIVGNRGFVSMEHGAEKFAERALYDAHNAGCFTGPVYENLSAVAIFWMGNNVSECWYEMRLFLNPFAIGPMPDDFCTTFINNDNRVID
jgi:hypothetical protein